MGVLFLTTAIFGDFSKAVLRCLPFGFSFLQYQALAFLQECGLGVESTL